MSLRLLSRKIRRLVLFLSLNRRSRLDLRERGGGLLVFAIGELPKDAGRGLGIAIVQREETRGHPRGAALAVGIVQSGRTHPHGYLPAWRCCCWEETTSPPFTATMVAESRSATE